MTNIDRPKVGVGVIIKRDDKVLLGKRKKAHGQGTWHFPGGHLEYGESIIDCARREVLEETGLIISNPVIGPFTNDIFADEHKHYITIFVVCSSDQGSPQLLEPDQCEGWEWFEWDDLPKPLFLPLQNLLKQNFNPFKLS